MWNIYKVDHYAARRKNEMMPFVTTWMDLESTILSEIRQRQILYITYTWNLIYDAHELIYKTETDSQT